MQFSLKSLATMFFLVNFLVLANMGLALASTTASVSRDCRPE
jgi:hypothetical protein